ncbi:carbohydrate sulfotransferase 11-like [Eriocheir sinensis]|uniref:carbohydrate sulfotransferase 11-like n=1 Tax=Eriocheir sinensis TaxID=95602 RepID=UPI0021C9590E|nr:carbohydrate sulfotransferase 11-like [Eriocheir sinensis]
MRCAADKVTRVCVTLLLLVFMVYLGSHGTQEPHTLVLPFTMPIQNVSTGSPAPSATSAKPPRSMRPFKVVKNKVIYLDPSAANDPSKVTTPQLSKAFDLNEIDYSKYNAEERQYLESRVPVMLERARQAGQACKEAPPSGTHFPHLVFDQVHDVVFCPNFKVASTTWMINFLKLAHFNDDNPAIPADLPPERRNQLKYSVKYGAKQYEVFNMYPTPSTMEEKMKVVRESARVIIVRHPFTRILSAYRDKMMKLLPKPPKFKFRELQKSIIKKYRPADSTDKSPFPSFSEFVQHVIDFTASFTRGLDWRMNVKCWVPFWAQCDVCSIGYNVIMKLETMPEDERFLITLTGMEELKKSEGEWRHLRNVSSSTAAADFYRQLTTRQMLDLHQRYKLDFDLYGYTLDDYLPLATDAPSRTHP